MKKLLVAAFAVACITACHKTKTQTKCVGKPVNQSTLSGTWTEENFGSPATHEFAQTMYKFQFYGDSFHMQTWNVTDAITTGNCSQNPHYEYAKGSWTAENGLLYLKGIYTNDLYGTKTDTCFKSGELFYTCLLSICNDILQFNPPSAAATISRKLYKN